jgi:hypothetical protein
VQHGREQRPRSLLAGHDDQPSTDLGDLANHFVRDVVGVGLPGVMHPVLEVPLRPVVTGRHMQWVSLAPGNALGTRRLAKCRGLRVDGDDVGARPVGDDHDVWDRQMRRCQVRQEIR